MTDAKKQYKFKGTTIFKVEQKVLSFESNSELRNIVNGLAKNIDKRKKLNSNYYLLVLFLRKNLSLHKCQLKKCYVVNNRQILV